MSLENAWYRDSLWPKVFTPVSWLFRALAKQRRKRLTASQWQSPVPLIVVGNISVGGTGKSPLTIELIGWLRELGYRPGVVSRGYGANPPRFPYWVRFDDSPRNTGDEPLMIVHRTNVPMVIDPDRVRACKTLLEEGGVDVIISDDGLQHYAMGRDIEIAVIDAKRGLGNGLCLPAGPLREPAQRLDEIDFVVVNGEGAFEHPAGLSMRLAPAVWHTVATDQRTELTKFGHKKVHAVAAIGHPERFFTTLEAMGIEVIRHAFADHHVFAEQDLRFGDDLPICMTEKDAVKCAEIAPANSYYLAVDAELEPRFRERLVSLLALVKATK